MSVTLQKAIVCTVRWPRLSAKKTQLAPEQIIAASLPEMDAKVEAHIEAVATAFRKHAAAVSARAAGTLRAEYKAARDALAVIQDGE